MNACAGGWFAGPDIATAQYPAASRNPPGRVSEQSLYNRLRDGRLGVGHRLPRSPATGASAQSSAKSATASQPCSPQV